MMRCERLERLAKTAASGQRTKPPRLTQRPVARHSLQMADWGGARPLLRTLVAFLRRLIFFLFAQDGGIVTADRRG